MKGQANTEGVGVRLGFERNAPEIKNGYELCQDEIVSANKRARVGGRRPVGKQAYKTVASSR